MQTAHNAPDIEGIAHWEESVSAWMDAESTRDWADKLDTAAGRRTWEMYHLIGDVLRSADLALKPATDFNARLAQALEREPTFSVGARRRLLVRGGLSGLALAATVAAVVWIARPDLIDAEPGVTVLAEAGTAPVAPFGLNDYLDAHWQMAGPSAVRHVSFDAGVER